MTRDGGMKVRGLTPPDDIRHRILEWNPGRQRWQTRELTSRRDIIGKDQDLQAYAGSNGATYRLGRAMPLRKLSQQKYDQARKTRGHEGPFMPVLFEACGEEQYAYEYRQGRTSYGAFTYSLVQALREKPESTFREAIDQANALLREFGFDLQAAQVVGPSGVVDKAIPGGPVQTTRDK